MPSSKRSKPRPRPPAHKPAAHARPASPKGGSSKKAPAKKPSRPAPSKRPTPAKKAASSNPGTAAEKLPQAELAVPLPGGRRHVLSLAFVRDGDEFLARLETDAGHITELKNRSLDQLLTLVAGELEDLLE